jgi:hypothetical protein
LVYSYAAYQAVNRVIHYKPVVYVREKMHQPWNYDQLRGHIRTLGNKQHLLDLVSSIDRNIDIFRYRLFTALDSLKPFFHAHGMATEEDFDLVLGISDRMDEFNHAELVNEANTIAAIYTVKSLYEHFAQLINGLLLNDLLTPYECSLSRVKSNLEPSELLVCLKKLMESNGYKYIDAFANVSKHRYLIKQALTISTVENKSGVRFKEFKYNKADYSSMWSNEILESVMNTQNIIIEAGVW